jgi:hypothetical protein
VYRLCGLTHVRDAECRGCPGSTVFPGSDHRGGSIVPPCQTIKLSLPPHMGHPLTRPRSHGCRRKGILCVSEAACPHITWMATLIFIGRSACSGVSTSGWSGPERPRSSMTSSSRARRAQAHLALPSACGAHWTLLRVPPPLPDVLCQGPRKTLHEAGNRKSMWVQTRLAPECNDCRPH